MHVLGPKWDNKNQTLNVSRGLNKYKKNLITQRNVLFYVKSIFLPNGFSRHVHRSWLGLNDGSFALLWSPLWWAIGKWVSRKFHTMTSGLPMHMFGDITQYFFLPRCFPGHLPRRHKWNKDCFCFQWNLSSADKSVSVPELELKNSNIYTFRLIAPLYCSCWTLPASCMPLRLIGFAKLLVFVEELLSHC